MTWPSRASRVARSALPILPLVLGIACLLLFDLTDQADPPRVQPVTSVPATRLVVVMVDALDRRDVAPDGMPKLAARVRRGGLHGPVRACVDGITIPCVTAMITGFDRASPFSALRNFGAARGLVDSSVLGALAQRGHRIGYFGESLLARALAGLSEVRITQTGYPQTQDVLTLHAALDALNRERLDVVFVHLLSIDEAAHKFSATSLEYQHARARADHAIELAAGQLRDTDHLAVVGDHGHAESGRHSAGVGTETFAAYFGPRFSGASERALAITDHARIWARIFGLRWGEPSAIDTYFDPAVASAPREPPATLAMRPRSVGPLALVLLLALAMAGAQAELHPLRRSFWCRRRVWSLLLGGTLMLALGLSWSRLWPLLARPAGSLTLSLLLGLAGIFLVRAWTVSAEAPRGSQVPGLALAGALLWAPATLAPSTGVQTPLLWLLAVLACLIGASRAASGSTRGVLALALAIAAATHPVSIVDYVPRAFPVWERAAAQLGAALPVALFVGAVALASRLRSVPAALLGCVVAALLERTFDDWFLLPCALALPLTFTALCVTSWFDVACLLVPASCWFFFQRDPSALTPIAAIWLLWASVPPRLEARAPLLRGAVWVLLMWLGLWTTMRTRMGGVDFDFYFRWLPHDAPATSEAVQQGLLTAVKCMLPVFFGALLARRSGARLADTLRVAEHLTRVRLALVLLFLIGVSIGRAHDVHLLYDVTQEAAFWMLHFAVLGLISLAHSLAQRRDAACDARAREPQAPTSSTLKV